MPRSSERRKARGSVHAAPSSGAIPQTVGIRGGGTVDGDDVDEGERAGGGGGGGGFELQAELEREGAGERHEPLEPDQRLEAALRRVLPAVAARDADPDDIQEVVDHIVECFRADPMPLPHLATQRTEVANLSLDEIESHPLASLLFPALAELLGVGVAPGPDANRVGSGSTRRDPPSVDRDVVVSEVLLECAMADQRRSAALDDEADDERGARYRKGTLGHCELCERRMLLTAHHLIPRSTHEAMFRRRHFTRAFMLSHLAWLCRACHSFLHAHLDADSLALEHNTVPRLLRVESVSRWARYAASQKQRDAAYLGVGRYDGVQTRLREPR